jgi:transcriptional regulator GlxA family with amidase domain
VHRVAALAVDGVVAFDLSIPSQVFGHRDERGRYEFSVCGAGRAPVRTAAGFDVVPTHGLTGLRGADTIVVPGIDPVDVPVPAPVLAALRAADRRGARLLSICTGAFVLAAAGVLDGRRVATHWRDAAALRARFPGVEVDADVLYVDDGRILSSAGVAAGIDLCLHVVASDHGADAAAAVARRMVVAPHRSGGQAQFVERPLPPDHGGLVATREWMLEHLERPLTVAEMARHALLSERSFARHFRAETGTSPLRWLHEQRVLHARRLLEQSDLSVEEVATSCGFGTATTLREHFARAVRSTPTAYRRAFRTVAP